MDTSTVILQIAAILIIARIFGEIAANFNIPSVIGELCAGILLGPTFLGLIEPDGMIRVLAEIGIILLLFQIGLETNLQNLVNTGNKSIIVATGGFVLPFVTCFGLSYYVFDLPQLVSLLIAGTMTATSIGITMRSLTDIGRDKSKEGQIVLGAAVLDDIMGVLLLAILFDFSQTGSIDLTSAARILLFMIVFFLVAPTIAKSISFIIRRFEGMSKIPGLVPTTIVSLVLSLAWLSHAIGIPELLGGFATGLALSQRFFIPFGVSLRADPEFSDHVHSEMKPIIQLFTPIFFVMVGLSLDLSEIDWTSHFFWYFSVSLTAIAIVSKMGGAILIREKFARRVVTGMAMVPRGEVGLIFAELGRTSGLLNNEIYATVVMVIAYTTLFTPFWLRLFYKNFGKYMDD
ncbi:cation:proton antiporter [Aliikangiella sp. G2MR2-5]|uniref:cation:proton antiporter n=1 Tax=Aliikangiella sp. G2MR2-5 TaxID=2788943 RepID=UPI0018ABBE18|nr:cation:proton antiporter [Aliikangiella sp. G2MR2-5]